MAVFFADSAGAQGTGTGVSEANAATLKECIENDVGLHTSLVAGSIINCKNGTTITYDGSGGDFANTAVAGTADAHIQVIGYTTTVLDGGIVDLVDSNAGATSLCFDVNHAYWHFENVRVTDARDAWNIEAGAVGCYFRNCVAIDAAFEGWDFQGATGDSPTLIDCYASGCGGAGFNVPVRNPRLVNCVSINNGATGFTAGAANQGAIFINCLAHANTGDGFVTLGEAVFINCVSNRNTSDGYFCDGGNGYSVLVNCGATSNGAFGVNGDSGAVVYAINCGLNPTNETNTSGKSTNVVLRETGAIAGDPDFADSNPATETDVDLSLSSSSAWKAAGIGIGGVQYSVANFADLGPLQREEPAGGGGVSAGRSYPRGVL